MSLDNINKDVEGSNIPEPDMSGMFCSQPFENLEVDTVGNVRTCCAYWMNETIGNLSENSFDDVINSKKARQIRASIHDGSFIFCNKRTCPRIQSGGDDALVKISDVKDPRLLKIIENKETRLNNLKFINFLWDLSCNLMCPSCRIGKIINTKGEDYNRSLDIQEKVTNYVIENNGDENVTFNITGSGDPFGSKIFRDFLINFDGKKHPNIQINLQTNGVMFTRKMWDMMSKCHDNINTILVSIDAASEETYDKIRVGGNWKILMENIRMLSDFKNDRLFDFLRLDFVVQVQNYKEIPEAVMLAESLSGVDAVSFSIITDWGTWPREEYEKHAVWMESNEKYNDFIRTLRDPILKSPKCQLGNITEFHRIAHEN